MLLQVDDSCVFRHKNERRVRTVEEEDAASVAESSVDLELKEESLEDDSPDDEDAPKKSEERDNGGDDDDILEQEDIEHAADEMSEEEKSPLGDVENADTFDGFSDVRIEEKLKTSVPDNETKAAANEEQCEFPDTSIQLHHVKGGE